MCLTITSNWEEELKEFISGRKEITAYKLITTDNTSIFSSYEWTIGENKSDRKSVELSAKELKDNKVDCGIHLYIEKPILNCPELKDTICPYPYHYRQPCQYLRQCLYRHRCPRPYPCPRPYTHPYRRLYQKLIQVTVNTNDIVATGIYGEHKSIVVDKCTVNSLEAIDIK